MTCETCRWFKISWSLKKCGRYPKWVSISDPKEHACGEYARPPAVMQPLTKEELAAKKKEENRPVTDEERREQAKRDYGRGKRQ